MKKPFRVGDRVRVYEGGHSRDGIVTEPIEGQHPNGSIWVAFFSPFYGRNAQACSPEQCRRLVKKKRERIWVEPGRVFAQTEAAYNLKHISFSRVHGWDEYIKVKRST